MIHILLTYNDLFGEKVEFDEVIKMISAMNHKHIAHLMIAIMNRDVKKQDFKMLYLKNKIEIVSDGNRTKYGDMQKTKLISECLNQNNEIFSVQGMLFLLKYIFVYSENVQKCEVDVLHIFEENIMVEVIDIQLMLCDYMQIEIDDTPLLEFNMKKFHLGINLKSLISRTWYIYCKLAIDRSKITVSDRQYLDFNLAYSNVKGYNIEEFLAVYFFIYNQFNNKNGVSPYINHKDHFKEAKDADKCHKILMDSFWTTEEFVEKAKSSLKNTWDFEMLTFRPFVACDANYWIVPSDLHLQALLYNNFRDTIQKIYCENENQFKQYLGYPFETYIQELCFSACEKAGLNSKAEFTIKGNEKSSEFYIWKDKKMIVIEAKSKDIDRNKLFSKTDSKIIEGIVLDQFIKPIHQIDKTCQSILLSQHKGLLLGIKEIIAISVTFENTHLSVNAYYDYATKSLKSDEFRITTPEIKAFLNFGIEEFECLIWLAENGYDIFYILTDYFEISRSVPFYNYLLEKKIKFLVVPEFLNEIYADATKSFINILKA